MLLDQYLLGDVWCGEGKDGKGYSSSSQRPQLFSPASHSGKRVIQNKEFQVALSPLQEGEKMSRPDSRILILTQLSLFSYFNFI